MNFITIKRGERIYLRKWLRVVSARRFNFNIRKTLITILAVIVSGAITAFSIVTFAPESRIAAVIDNTIHAADKAVFLPKSQTGIKKMFKDQTGFFAVLSIQNKTFEVKKGIDEITLKKNVGWWETSAPIGGVGNCVIMGHRDQDLKILKFVEVGETITATLADGMEYCYTVTETKVLQSDLELTFQDTEEKQMVIITCYPFHYAGHAPKKFVLTAVIKDGTEALIDGQ